MSNNEIDGDHGTDLVVENFVDLTAEETAHEAQSANLVKLYTGSTVVRGVIPTNTLIVVIDGALIVDATEIGHDVTLITKAIDDERHQAQIALWRELSQKTAAEEASTTLPATTNSSETAPVTGNMTPAEASYLEEVTASRIKKLDILIKASSLPPSSSLTNAFAGDVPGLKLHINTPGSVIMDGHAPPHTKVSCSGDCIINGTLGVAGTIDCGGRAFVHGTGDVSCITSYGEITCAHDVGNQGILTSSRGIALGGTLPEDGFMLTGGDLILHTDTYHVLTKDDGTLPERVIARGTIEHRTENISFGATPTPPTALN